MQLKILLFLLYGFPLLMLNYGAFSCTVVANAQLLENDNNIKIIRNMQEQILMPNANLCIGDIIIVPESAIESVILHYYSQNLEQKQLVAGEHYEIIGLDKPCDEWCEINQKTKRLYVYLTRKNISPPKHITETERGDDESLSTSTLIVSQPLYLFADNGKINFFWKGGEPPYQLFVKDKKEQTLISKQKLYEKHVEFEITNVNLNQTYQLIIQDRQQNHLEVGIVFRLPPFPLDPDENKLLRLTRLLRDTERNWRLEVWRQLQSLGNTRKVNKFKAHLIVGDF